jgi:hypothetical protein
MLVGRIFRYTSQDIKLGGTMPYKEIEYLSASDIGYKDGRLDTIVISIRNSHTEPARIKDGFKDVLYLEFDNVEHLSHRGLRFSKSHAEEIFAFVAKHEEAASRILVNCLAGESRSAAVALYLSEKYTLPLAFPDNPLIWVYHVLERTEELTQRRQALQQ